MAKVEKLHILVVFGTRPEAIKLAPVIDEIQAHAALFKLTVCSTGQHRQLLDQVSRLFAVPIHHDLGVMQSNQTLEQVSVRILERFSDLLRREKPDLVLVHGDTTTTFAASLAAFYQKIKVGHVEAGLRTEDKLAPFPEEINRRLTAQLADYHFAPTEWAKQNLLREGTPEKSVFVTGNTVIDAFLRARRMVLEHPPKVPELNGLKAKGRKLVVVTAHRRENFGPGLEGICQALKQIVTNRDDVEIVYPVHPNPNVHVPVHQWLGGVPRIKLIPPLEYLPFVWLLCHADMALTDSGGIQEEMVELRRPVLVLRDKTERPEGVEAGVCKLVGTNCKAIEESVTHLLDNKNGWYKREAEPNPFGDGKAAQRIVGHLRAVRTDP